MYQEGKARSSRRARQDRNIFESGKNYNTGEQNKDMSVTRQDRDWKDSNTVLRYLSDRNPVTSDIALHNISTGGHAHSSIDADQAKTVGKAILNDMKGQCVMEDI